MNNHNTEIDIEKNKFPFCIVWTPLPLLSWFLPIIGHTGICTSDGIIHDFAGSKYISIDDFAFGDPYKYVPLSSLDNQVWDDALINADKKYRRMNHNLFTNNCHSHVAEVLNNMNYDNRNDYNMISVWWLCLRRGKFISITHFIKTYWFFLLLIIIYLLKFK